MPVGYTRWQSWAKPCSWVSLVLAIGMVQLGCNRQTAAPEQPPPLSVTVSLPIQRQVSDFEEFTGRTAAIDSVQVRARVNGYLQKINFKEGAEVNRGDVLYEIDPRPYQAALSQSEAQVNLQEAQLKNAEAIYARNERLLRAGQAVSVEDTQQSLAQRDVARASLAAAKANVEQARLNQEWTKVTAPINGRVSRTFMTRGNLVVADQTLLTTVVSMDPIYAYADVDERTMLRVQELMRQGKFRSARESGVKVPIYLGLANEEGYPHEGFVDFVNNQVDPSTATLQIRGLFPNPKPAVGDRVLSPGLFVRIRVHIGPPYQALLVNERAIGNDQNVRFVYVVDDQNKVIRHDVQLGNEHGRLQVITRGLKANERVIINGLQHVRQDMVVDPQVVEMPDASSETTASRTP